MVLLNTVELSLVPASTPPSGSLHQEQSNPWEFQKLLPSPRTRKGILGSGSPHHLVPSMLDDPWKGTNKMRESKQCVKPDSTINRPVLIDVKETRHSSVVFCFGIADQCTRQQNILGFLMSGSCITGKEELDFSLISDLLGHNACKIYTQLNKSPGENRFNELWLDHYQRSLIYSRSELYSKASSPGDFVKDLGSRFNIIDQPGGQASFSGTRTEEKDLLSIVEEFHPSKVSTECRNQPLLLPYATRTETSENSQASSSKIQTVAITSIKSHEKIHLKPPPKKRNIRKAGKERDAYRRSYLHACESLLSLILKKRHGKAAILNLKNSGPELPQLLTQFSAGIAGTGLAVLFSVGCKVSGGRVPFCASKMLSTGVGMGLVWMSWAVNKLRNTIIHSSKKTNCATGKDREMIRKVDENVKEMLLRAATVMVFAMLKFA